MNYIPSFIFLLVTVLKRFLFSLMVDQPRNFQTFNHQKLLSKNEETNQSVSTTLFYSQTIRYNYRKRTVTQSPSRKRERLALLFPRRHSGRGSTLITGGARGARITNRIESHYTREHRACGRTARGCVRVRCIFSSLFSGRGSRGLPWL